MVNFKFLNFRSYRFTGKGSLLLSLHATKSSFPNLTIFSPFCIPSGGVMRVYALNQSTTILEKLYYFFLEVV